MAHRNVRSNKIPEITVFLIKNEPKLEIHDDDDDDVLHGYDGSSGPIRTFVNDTVANGNCVDDQTHMKKHLNIEFSIEPDEVGKDFIVKIHNENERQFDCGICGKNFRVESELDEHLKRHNNEKSFTAYRWQCQFCSRRFIYKSKLLRHTVSHTGEKPYSCHICWEKFSHNNGLSVHKKKCHAYAAALDEENEEENNEEKCLRSYECFDCKKKFDRFVDLHWHMNEHINWLKKTTIRDSARVVSLFVCTMCDKAFAKKSFLMHHAVTLHKLDRLFDCDTCGRYFQTKNELDEHSKKQPIVGVAEKCRYTLRCDFCSRRFGTAFQLNVHMRMHTGERPLECPVCGMDFASPSNFLKHKKLHVAKKYEDITKRTPSDNTYKFECTRCEYTCSSIRYYLIHKKTHTAQIYDCEHCDESFEKKHQLSDHVNDSHADRLESVHCNKCSMKFPLEIFLLQHLDIHKRPPEQHLCADCGKIFSSNRAIKTHRITHRIDRKFACAKCPKRFKTKSELREHGSVHSPKSLMCTICNKTYGRRNALRKHEREQHELGRQFACELCSATFYKKFHLQNHMRTHTGEKPFKCDHCERSFAQRSEISSHIKVHLGPTPHQCNECGQSFRLITELRKHSYEHYTSATNQ